VDHFQRKFQGIGGRPPTTVGFRKLVPELSRGIVCVILRLAVLTQYRRVTDTHAHTETHTHTDRHTAHDTTTANTRAWHVPRG